VLSQLTGRTVYDNMNSVLEKGPYFNHLLCYMLKRKRAHNQRNSRSCTTLIRCSRNVCTPSKALGQTTAPSKPVKQPPLAPFLANQSSKLLRLCKTRCSRKSCAREQAGLAPATVVEWGHGLKFYVLKYSSQHTSSRRSVGHLPRPPHSPDNATLLPLRRSLHPCKWTHSHSSCAKGKGAAASRWPLCLNVLIGCAWLCMRRALRPASRCVKTWFKSEFKATYAHTHTLTHNTCVHARMHASMHTRIHTLVCATHTHTYTHAHMHAHTHAHTHVHATHAHTQVGAVAHLLTVNTHTHAHTRTHTCTRITRTHAGGSCRSPPYSGASFTPLHCGGMVSAASLMRALATCCPVPSSSQWRSTCLVGKLEEMVRSKCRSARQLE